MGYNSFIKGGLPLNSNDFVDRESALANKSRLLVALDKISKLHNRQMQTYDKSMSENNIAVDKTIDTVSNKFPKLTNADFNFNTPTDQSYDSSPGGLWQAPAITDVPTPQTEQGQTLGNIFDQKDDTQDEFEDESAYDQVENNGYDQFTPNELGENNENTFDETIEIPHDAGDPVYTVDDKTLGKRGSNTNKFGKVGGARAIAWLAYIVFFLPLLFMGKNDFVKHHANNGLCFNIIDAIGVGLIFLEKLKYFETNNNKWVALALMISTLLGFILLALMALIKIIAIFICWTGKEVHNPVLRKFNVIK